MSDKHNRVSAEIAELLGIGEHDPACGPDELAILLRKRYSAAYSRGESTEPSALINQAAESITERIGSSCLSMDDDAVWLDCLKAKAIIGKALESFRLALEYSRGPKRVLVGVCPACPFVWEFDYQAHGHCPECGAGYRIEAITTLLHDVNERITAKRGPKIEDEEVTRLIKEARAWAMKERSLIFNGDIDPPEASRMMDRIAIALEREIEARREAEEQTRVWIAECERLNAAQLTKPTQSGEPVCAACGRAHCDLLPTPNVEALPPIEGSWSWALAMMKAGHPVRLPDHVEGGLVVTKDGWIDFASADEDDHEPFLFAIEDFDSISWQLAPVDVEEPGPCEQQ